MKSDWVLTEEGFDPSRTGRRESLFSLGNGYLGFRGFYEEQLPSYHRGIFINGFYDLEEIVYGEEAYGFPKVNQKMIDLPDLRGFSIMVDGERLNLAEGKVHSCSRTLDLREGVIRRRVDWESEFSSRVVLTSEFTVSYTNKHLAAVRLTVEPVRCNRLEVISSVSMPAAPAADPSDPRVGKGRHAHLEMTGISCGEHTLAASFRAVGSDLKLACGAVLTDISCDEELIEREEYPEIVLSSEFGRPVACTKYCFYTHDTKEEAASAALKELMEAVGPGWFDTLAAGQKETLSGFWETSSVEIPDDPHLEKSIRFNLFGLYQSVGKDGRSSLAAKGLTGAGYEGHYFWDTEIYGMPFFTYTRPQIARSLLAYRISTIPEARKRAAEMRQKGILFPWRTIDGREASAYFPAGTAQYHINADIAYSLVTYLEVTGDDAILAEGGAELLFETARFWYDLGFFNPRRKGAFCIHEVTGPDEYTALVNNNLYTNLMAQFNLRKAAGIYREYPGLGESLGFPPEEASGWETAANLMFIPFDRETGLHPQDDQFLDRERWDFASYPADGYPLLLHCHPLVIYRYQVLKQADVVLAHLLLPDAFPLYERRRDFSYYEELTTGDSSLSACIQGIIATEVGQMDTGYRYLRRTALVDLDDLQGNTKDGLHTASMGGSWMALVYGLAGLRWRDGHLSFAPKVYEELSSYGFRIQSAGVLLHVSVNEGETTYTATGGSLGIMHHGKDLRITEGSPVTVGTTPSLQAVVFDLDGVITSTDGLHFQAWKQLADEEGWAFDRETNEHLRGVSRKESLLIITGHNGIELTDEAQIRLLTDRKNATYRELLKGITPADLLPGFVRLAEELKGRGILIGIASASRNAPYILERLGIGDLIDALVPAAEVSVGKPDPEVFLRCADMLGVSPLACAAIEDAKAGIEAIKAAGMHSIGIGEAAKEAEMPVGDLTEVSYGRISSLWGDQDQ